MHLITLSFDDGFLKSNLKIAELYERHGLSACFNIVASAHRPEFRLPNPTHGPPVGDFGVWNELQARGHEVMPHGFRHANKSRMPLSEAQDLIRRGLDVFTAELRGFDPRRAVFNFPYNASSPELEAWMPTVVRAYRTEGARGPIMPLPNPGQTRLDTTSAGPGNAEAAVDRWIAELLSRPSGWLLFCLHGLDEEGWGPIRATYLERLLARLAATPSVRVIPAARALAEAPAPF
ncbi:MAG: Polysaccharide deacetylase [Lentisphaerae bacterium ADurb.BinA184]|mgnify:FL=1|nr:MAG: Polysaccharide deacetylase [Lentisphaerae bacterium ADurb.BinA184]